ncbi:hypothetical protein, partial [Peribacillus frigoritolerans]|uniref:hypothetical protein n=1 Tax=Peribacillus frigoritolerans TaxID=450367 RepID=UPI003015E2B8
MVFYCNLHWIEEICDTPAELLASRDPTGAGAEEAWQTVGGKGADLFNQLNFLNKKLQANLNCPVNVRHQTNIYGVFFMANFSAEQKIFITRLY